MPAGVPGGKYVIGLDLGRVVDPSAYVVLDLQSMQVVSEEVRQLKEPHEIGSRYAAQMCARWGKCPMVIDTTGGGGGSVKKKPDQYVKLYRETVRHARPFYFTKDTKRNAVEQLVLGIEQGKIGIPAECSQLLRQLAEYEYRLNSTGYVEYSAPAGLHDDLVMALAMAYDYAVRNGSSVKPVDLSTIM